MHVITIYCYLLLLQTERQLDCALDLMRRLPPQQIEKNLSDVIDLVSLTFIYSVEEVDKLLFKLQKLCVYDSMYFVMEFIKG